MSDSDPPSFNKEKFDAFMALADQRMKRRMERTQYEWRMSFSLWAFLAAATFYLHPRPPESLLIVLLMAMVIFHFWYISEVRKRNRLDTEMSFYYIDHAEHILSLLVKVRNRPSYKEAMAYSLRNVFGLLRQDFWWSGIEIAISVALALSAYWFMGTFNPLAK